MPQNHQPEVLHMSNRISYKLKTGRCHKTISQKFYTYKQNPLLANDRQMTHNHQSEALYMSNSASGLHPDNQCQIFVTTCFCLSCLWNTPILRREPFIIPKSVTNLLTTILNGTPSDKMQYLCELQDRPSGHFSHTPAIVNGKMLYH